MAREMRRAGKRAESLASHLASKYKIARIEDNHGDSIVAAIDHSFLR